MHTREQTIKKLNDKYTLVIDGDEILANGIKFNINDFYHDEIKESVPEQNVDKIKRALELEKLEVRYYDFSRIERFIDESLKEDKKTWG